MPKHRDLQQNRRIGGKLRRFRNERRLTLADVGQVLGVSQQQVQKYESGSNAVPLASFAVLADLYGVRADALFEEDATFPGGMETECDMLDLYSTIVGVHDPVLRRKIRRVVEILAA